MKLKIKDVDLSTGGPLVAIIHESDATKLGAHAGDRIRLERIKKRTEIVAVVDVSTRGIVPGEIGLFEEDLKLLKAERGTHIEVCLSEKPLSVQHIKEKIEGEELKPEDINEIIKDIIGNRLSEVEMTYFVSACYMNGLSMEETAALTRAIVASGEQMHFGKKIVIDKHCIGGVANNRTTMIGVPILASLGYTMPKTSSRAITSPAGTADTMEVLAPVALPMQKIKEVINKVGACIAWGGGTNLAAADDKLIRIRHPLQIDPEGMMLASILAKKKAVGATHVLIDIPYGYSAKFDTKAHASKLGKKFMKLGKVLGMKVKFVLTDGSQPIGNGIGPALEAADVISVLQNDGPNDLREKAIYIATEALEMIGVKNAHEKVLDSLDSGRAYGKFMDIIQAQGGKKNIRIPMAKFFHEVMAEKPGTVAIVNNKGISRLAYVAGAPIDKVAGIYLRVHKGTKVKKGDILFTVYAKSKAKLDQAVCVLKQVEHVVIK